MLSLAGCGQDQAPLTAGVPAQQLGDAPASPRRILIIGGTSGIGLETTRLALQRGHQVSAMSRNPERVAFDHKNLTLIKGNVLDAAAVKAAVQNHEAVIFSVGMKPTRKPVTLFSEGTKNVLAAMQAGNVQRLLWVSGIGAGDSRGHGSFFYDNILQPLLLNTIYQDKDRSEQLISQSDTRWTIVRPGFLDDTEALASYRIIEEMAGVTSRNISRKDVAHFMVASLESGSYVGRTVLLSN